MKTKILSGIFFCLLALLCLGHVGQLVELLPRAWFLMFVGLSAFLSYAALGWLLILHALKERREELAKQNRRRIKGDPWLAGLAKAFRDADRNRVQ